MTLGVLLLANLCLVPLVWLIAGLIGAAEHLSDTWESVFVGFVISLIYCCYGIVYDHSLWHRNDVNVELQTKEIIMQLVPRSWVSMGDMKPWIVITSVLAAVQALIFIWYCSQIVFWETFPYLGRTLLLNLAVIAAWFFGSFDVRKPL